LPSPEQVGDFLAVIPDLIRNPVTFQENTWIPAFAGMTIGVALLPQVLVKPRLKGFLCVLAALRETPFSYFLLVPACPALEPSASNGTCPSQVKKPLPDE